MLIDINVDKARESLLDLVVPLGEETIYLEEALGRILGSDLRAPADLPPVAQAAVDGYALGGEGSGARGDYALQDGSRRQATFGPVLGPGQAAAVVTGGPLPTGTVEVVAREHARIEGNRLLTAALVTPGRNVKPAGEDFRAGEVVVPAGTRVDPGLTAVLAAFGQDGVPVRRCPRVGVLSLGREIVPHRYAPSAGQVRDANGPLLAALATRDGARVIAVETAGGDGLPEARVKLRRLWEHVEMVLTVGGVASGPDDYALSLLRESGARVLFWGVGIKPGHHSGAAVWEDRPVIALSGNPAACAVGYQLLAAPVLRAFQGITPFPAPVSAVCNDSFPKQGGPRRFLRGYAACGPEGWRVSLLPGQKSSMLRSLINWNALVDLPAGHQPVEPGSRVSFLPL
ncbi:MAG: molybdopterin molybdotransferase MoeA [Peptococcaceae bacterium]|jgi:molybdopterin molybdotransferase|nr:molybdopterin molybdotransferase MoeA [Peptococcaceae bacterium]